MENEFNFEIDEIVLFLGTKYYLKPENSFDSVFCQHGVAKIKDIDNDYYYVVGEPYGASTVNGWVLKDRLHKLSKQKLTDYSIDKLKYLGVIESSDYWKQLIRRNVIYGLDDLFIKSAQIINSSTKFRNGTTYSGIEYLTQVNIISAPTYWNLMAFKHHCMAYLLRVLGNYIEIKKDEKCLNDSEESLRLKVLKCVHTYIGYNQWDNSYKEIISLYNEYAYEHLKIHSDEDWSVVFVSFIGIKSGLQKLIPTDKNCQRQMVKLEAMNRFTKDFSKVKEGDLVYFMQTDDYSYMRSFENILGDSHMCVGIIVKIKGNEILIVEGDRRDCVCYNTIYSTGKNILGYGILDYKAYVKKSS